MADGLGTGRSFAAAQFGVLGPLQVRMGDESLPLGTPKQRAVLAQKPETLANPHGAALSQQAEQLSRLIAQMQRDVDSGDAATLRGRLPSMPLMPETR